MKRFVLVILALILIAGLVSCSQDAAVGAKTSDAAVSAGAVETKTAETEGLSSEETLPKTESVTVPDLSGADEETAIRTLTGKGFAFRIEREFSDSAAEKTVIRTDPEAGSEIGENGEVTVFVSDGPEAAAPTETAAPETSAPQTAPPQSTSPPASTAPSPKYVSVPDIKGLDETSAKAKIYDLGLSVALEYEFSESVSKGKVIKTDPAAKKSVVEKSTVTLTVSKGPQTFGVSEASVSWNDLKEGSGDVWTLDSVAVFGDLLLIHCTVKPGTDFVIRNSSGGIFSLADSFDKNASLALSDDLFTPFPDGKQFNAGEEAGLFFFVSPSQLGSKTPGLVKCRIPVSVDGENSNLEISFEMTW
ncbi:MAG: PASTA domain-containing protein [Clostridia bacterium]|nr:PASTA domain-containing protein [Clostridia bacterium]